MLGGNCRADRIEAHRALILTVLAKTPDSTIEDLRNVLAGRGHA